MLMKTYKIAVLDDYQNVALESADWSAIRDRADIAVFQNHLADPDAVIERLLPFDVVCAMRERTPLPRNVIERLPNLKLIASTGPGHLLRRSRAESLEDATRSGRQAVWSSLVRGSPAGNSTWQE
jgi:hypothetical protein